MSQITFYKVPSKGKFQDIESSVDSLHARRIIVIEDLDSSTFWIISGKSASAGARKNADRIIKKMIKESNSSMKSSEVDYEDAEDHILSLLSKTPSTTKKQAKEIPLVPNSAIDVLSRKKSKESEGPVIKEFEIAYYKEDSSEEESELSQQIEELLMRYSESVHGEARTPSSKTKAKKKLNTITNQLIQLIFD